MSDVSNEMLATVLVDMDRRLGQRLQKIESSLQDTAKESAQMKQTAQQLMLRVEQLGRTIDQIGQEGIMTRGASVTPDSSLQPALQKLDDVFRLYEEMTLPIGQLLSAAMRIKNKIADLSEVEFDVTSPGGEDGIIDWLIAHVPISARRFVETGAGDFKHGICRFLAVQRDWKGLLLDPDGVPLYHARRDDFYRRHNLLTFEASITRESVDEIIEVNEFAGNLGVLTVNAGGIEYWVWSGLSVTKPDIVVCVFNPVFGDKYAVTVPYNPNFDPLEVHPTNYYRGASIEALKKLAAEKGYVFLGTNSKGTNAFFVRAELADSVTPKIVHPRAFPARARNLQDTLEELESVGGISRLGLIKDLPVLDLVSGKTVKLGDLDQPYSEQWQRAMS